MIVKFLLILGLCYANSNYDWKWKRESINVAEYNSYLRAYNELIEENKQTIAILEEDIIHTKQDSYEDSYEDRYRKRYQDKKRKTYSAMIQKDIIHTKQEIIDTEQTIENMGKRARIFIIPAYVRLNGTRYRGHVFEIEFKSGTLEVCLFQSEEDREGFLRMTGPEGFEFGFKWRSTTSLDDWGYEYETCTKESRLALIKILELIDGVQVKPRNEWYARRESKDAWVNGKTEHQDNCIPDLHFTMKIENDFDPKKFDGLSEAIIQFGLGVKLTTKEVEKIENAKEAYRIRCKDGC